MERLTGHAELQELLGAYALDAVEPDEAALIERHLPTCPRCRNELADHREVAALLGYAGGTAPGGVWDRIIASLEEPPPALRLTRESIPTRRPQAPAAPPAAPTVAVPPRRPTQFAADATAAPVNPAPAVPGLLDLDAIAGQWGPRTPPPIHARESGQADRAGGDDNVVPIGGARSRRASGSRKTVPMRFMVLFASAAAVIIAALGVQVGRLEAHKPQISDLRALAFQAADADPRARHLTLTSPDGVHTVRAVVIEDGTTYLGPNNLADLPTDETYQMWGVVDGARVSLGPIGDNPTYAAFPTPAVATVLAMTVETRGGVPTSTKTPVVAGVLPGSGA